MSLLLNAWSGVATAPGTGTLTLGAAVPGAQTWAAAGAVDGDLYGYRLDDGPNWEIGVGTFGASGPTLARTQILASSAGGGAIAAGAAAVVANVVLPSDVAPSFRSRIINGSFAINQRGYSSGSTLAQNAVGHDRWKDFGGGGAVYYFNQGAVDTVITVGAGVLSQTIEAATIEGGTYTLAWTGSINMGVNYVAPGSSATTFAANGPSPLVVTGIPAGAKVTVYTSGTGTLGQVRFTPGAGPQPFERRDDELRRCQRYFCIVYPNLRVNNATNYQTFESTIYFPVKMYATPTSVLFASGVRSSGVAGTQAISINATSARFLVDTNNYGDIYTFGEGWAFIAEV